MQDKKSSRTRTVWFLLKAALVTLVEEETSTENLQNGSAASEPTTKYGLPEKLPSITEIKQKIPRHCFEPKVSTSMSYVFKDAARIIFAYFCSEFALNYLPIWTHFIHVPLYWLLQGTFFTAIFVLGHDCGHGSFSTNDWFNDFIGTILHSFLLTPYYMWKLSHRNHHKNTGNIDKDEVFYPVKKKENSDGYVLPGFGLGIGWFGYLFRGYKPRQVAHFNPYHRLFQKHVLGCFVSLLSDAVWLYVLYYFYMQKGALLFIHHYFIPLFVFASWNVMFTFLHHNNENIPWFSDEKWEYVRGQLSSIDRDYGWAHQITHNIGTHQIHHLFTKVPHYHLEEATEHFRREFPALVRYRMDAIIPTFIKMFKKYMKQCVIPDETSIHIYK